MKKNAHYKRKLGNVVLEFSINGISTIDASWVDADIKISSPVISYNLKDWETGGEIFTLSDVPHISQIMDEWLQGKYTSVKEYETLEPDLLLKFYPGEEKRIDFCVCLQTDKFAFTENYIVLPLYNKKATDFVKYWKQMELTLR